MTLTNLNRATAIGLTLTFGFNSLWCCPVQSADEAGNAGGHAAIAGHGAGAGFLQLRNADVRFRTAVEARKNKFLSQQREARRKKEKELGDAQILLLKIFSGGRSEDQLFARTSGINAVLRISDAKSPKEALEIATSLNESSKKGVTELLLEDITGKSKVLMNWNNGRLDVNFLDTPVVDAPSKRDADGAEDLNSSLRARLAVSLGILPPSFLEE